MRYAFVMALLSAFGWFCKELWPYVKTAIEDHKIQRRKEQLRLERERDTGRSVSE